MVHESDLTKSEISIQYKERIEKIFFTYINAVFIALGIVGNIFYFLCINKISTKKSHTYVYIRCLIITNFAVCLTITIWPSLFYVHKSQIFISSKSNVILLGKYTKSMQCSLMYLSNLLIVLISLDRVIALAFPIFYNKQMKTHVKYLLIIIAVISVGFGIPEIHYFTVVKFPVCLDVLTVVCGEELRCRLNYTAAFINSTGCRLTHCYAMCHNRVSWFSKLEMVTNITMFVLPFIVIVIANTTIIILSIKYYRKSVKTNHPSYIDKCQLNNGMSTSSTILPKMTTKICINKIIKIGNPEFKITVSMLALSTQFAICMIPLIFFVFKYQYAWRYDIADFNIFWFHTIAYMLKLANYSISVYVYLAFDPTVLEKIKNYIW
ncbi:unnamed protein product [Gordionus sp. m RMFG-2023]